MQLLKKNVLTCTITCIPPRKTVNISPRKESEELENVDDDGDDGPDSGLFL